MDDIRHRVIACAMRPVTLKELRCAIGISPNLTRIVRKLIESGEIQRYGVRNTFEMGSEELYICVRH